jgi:hypothetical protein
MKDHKELKKIIKEYNLISNMDHLIACDNHGWTDLRFTKLDLRLTPESKYFLSINMNNIPTILYYNNLLELRYEIDERMIKGSYVKGYYKKENRVMLHHIGDGKFRIGNESGKDTFYVQFEECSLKELTKRKNYYKFLELLDSNEKHRSIQTLLCEFGISLGFNVKLAINDNNAILKLNPQLLNAHKIINFYDLNLNHIEVTVEKKDIDSIDILWCEPLRKKIIVAFEVELSKNYSDVFRRFSSLINYASYNIQFICVGDDCNNCKYNFTRPDWRIKFAQHNIDYLCLNNLCDILTLNREMGSFISPIVLYKKLINEKLYPLTTCYN